MKVRPFGIALVIAAATALTACTSVKTPTNPTETSESPTIVAVYGSVQWYPACATYPVEIGGEQFYPLPMGAPPVDESNYPLPAANADSLAVRVILDLPQVAPPGPGDDIGRVIVYSDGMARFDSESGKASWLTREEQIYDYVC